MSNVATITGNHFLLAVEQHEQNSLKGILWQTAGNALSGAAIALTAGTTAVVAAGTLSSLGMLTSDPVRNSVGPFAVPLLLVSCTAAIAVNYVAIKATGGCYSNALYHLGPEYTIAKM